MKKQYPVGQRNKGIFFFKCFFSENQLIEKSVSHESATSHTHVVGGEHVWTLNREPNKCTKTVRRRQKIERFWIRFKQKTITAGEIARRRRKFLRFFSHLYVRKCIFLKDFELSRIKFLQISACGGLLYGNTVFLSLGPNFFRKIVLKS